MCYCNHKTNRRTKERLQSFLIFFTFFRVFLKKRLPEAAVNESKHQSKNYFFAFGAKDLTSSIFAEILLASFLSLAFCVAVILSDLKRLASLIKIPRYWFVITLYI